MNECMCGEKPIVGIYVIYYVCHQSALAAAAVLHIMRYCECMFPCTAYPATC